MKPFVQIRRLTFSYSSGKPVLNDLTVDFLKGAFVGLLGPSGSGKTTFLDLLAGIASPQTGTITYAQRDPAITFVFQRPVLFEHYSRKENAMYRSRRGAFRERFTLDRFEQLAKVLGMDGDFLDSTRPLRSMSGGEQQRLTLLRELSIAPDLLLLLDEPCSGLDPGVKRQFLLLLSETVSELGVKCMNLGIEESTPTVWLSRH